MAEILDLIPRRLPLAIVAACVAEDAAAALEACGRAGDAGIDPRRLGGALLQLLRDLTVLRVAPESRDLVEGTEEETAELRELAGQTEEARLRRMFRSLIREQEDLAWAPQPMAVLEMAVVRLATMPRGDDVARLIERIDQLERRLEGQAGSLTGTGGGGSGSATTRARREPERRAAAPTGAAPGSPGARVSAPAAARSDAKPDAPEPDAPLDVVFDRLCAAAREANRGLLAALDGGRLVERTADRLRIALPEGFGAQRLRDRVEVLEAVCTRLFGRKIRVEIEAEAAAEETAPERDDERLRRRRQEALDHPAVNDALNILGGEIVEIRPLGGDR